MKETTNPPRHRGGQPGNENRKGKGKPNNALRWQTLRISNDEVAEVVRRRGQPGRTEEKGEAM